MTEEERLAREEIRDLMARYNMAGDRRDFAGLAATFADDGEMHTQHGVFAGHDAIVAFLGGGYSGGAPPRADLKFTRHNVSTSLLRFETPAKAVGRTYFTVISDLGLDHAGVYVDILSKASGEWLFKKREIRIDYVHERSHMTPSRRS